MVHITFSACPLEILPSLEMHLHSKRPCFEELFPPPSPLSPPCGGWGIPNSATAAPSPPLSPPPAAARGRGRSQPGRYWRRRGLLVPSRGRDGAGCLLHGVGVVRPPGTMARLLTGVRRCEPWRSGAVAVWRTAWRLGGTEEAAKVMEKAEGGDVACPSWQPRCIS
jgi:hypothetical protein